MREPLPPNSLIEARAHRGIIKLDSPLTRVVLATIGGYLIILLFLSVHDWIIEEFPQRPVEPTNSARIQHQFYHQEATKALKLFSQLPLHDKVAIRESLKSNLISINKWLKYLERSNIQILCIGELHEESTRSFLSKEFFSIFSVDILLIEATPNELKHLINRMETGRDYFPLLGADIMNILRTVRTTNPNIMINGIEETDKQSKFHDGHTNTRDQSIAYNFWHIFEPGLTHVILYGALHCTNESNWLFHNLCSQASPVLKDKMLNVRILGEHQNGPLEAFVYFLDEIAVNKRHFVIPDTRLLHPRIYEMFPSLSGQTLSKYRSLVVFRT